MNLFGDLDCHHPDATLSHRVRDQLDRKLGLRTDNVKVREHRIIVHFDRGELEHFLNSLPERAA